MILVVGATGQLGTAIIRKLQAQGKSIRALVRRTSNYAHLQNQGIEIVYGDLRDAASLDAACSGIETIIATANTAAPTQKGDNFKSVDIDGYQHLISAAQKHNVEQFIYTSAVVYKKLDSMSPLANAKRDIEKALQRSGLKYTIFQPPAFMDVYFAFLGSDLPTHGAEASTVNRSFGFMQMFFGSVKNNISQKNSIGIIGSGTTHQPYICIDDVAEFHVRAIGNSDVYNQIFEIGGPEMLCPMDIKAIYEKLMNKTLKIQRMPPIIFKVGNVLTSAFAPAISNIMALNYLSAMEDCVIDASRANRIFNVQLTSAEKFLASKLQQNGS